MTAQQQHGPPAHDPDQRDGTTGTAAPTDAQLIGDTVDPAATFGLLFDRHHGAVHRYLARRAGTSVADDLASETFLVALRSRARYDPAVPDARPWLLGISTNLLRRHRRAEALHLRARAGLVEIGPDPADSVTDRVAAAADLQRMAERIGRLQATDRDTLLLYALGQLTYAEVGVALGIPTGTVRSRLNRCRRLLGVLPAPLPAHLPITGPEACHD